MYEDKTLVCKDCGNEFVFTAGEQEFYAERGFTNEPKRCKACRDAKRGGAPRQEREMFTAVCDSCGGEAYRILKLLKRRICCLLLRLPQNSASVLICMRFTTHLYFSLY